MIRILLVEGNNMEAGGVEAYLLNVLTQIKRDNLEIDILVPGRIVSEDTGNRFRSLGCYIQELHIKSGRFEETIGLFSKLKKYLDINKYNIIHVNTANLRVEAICAILAKRKGIKTRIAHSHGTLLPGSAMKELARNLLRSVVVHSATDFLACSLSAAEALVGKKHCPEVEIARNGIKTKDYKFDSQVRRKIREKNGWENRFVIGFIARLSPEKNHLFMLQVVKQLTLNNKRVLLVIIGTGDKKYEQKIRSETEKLNLLGHVQFLGERNDVNELVQGVDFHVLPSIREALGIANIEAQAAGLHCICSDRVPREADVTGLVDFVPLEKGADFWAKCIEQYDNGYERKDTTNMIIGKGYDITCSAKIIDRIYNSSPGGF